MFLVWFKNAVFISLGYSSKKEIKRKEEKTWKDMWMAF